MTQRGAPPRGGASVGLLNDLPPLEAGAVRYLRHWFSGAEARSDLHQAFHGKLGAPIAESAFESFGALCDFCVKHGRRPLVRHGMTCSCLGADENCFANLVAAAAAGDLEDAELLASLIVPPKRAHQLCHLAVQCGLYLQQISQNAPPRRTYRPGNATLH